MRKLARLIAPVAMMASCGGASPAVVIAPSTSAPAQASATALAEKRADLSPVTKPKTVMVVARFNDIGRSIDAVDGILKLPTTLRSLALARLKAEDADFVQLSGSLDFAVAVNPTTREGSPALLWAVSIPLKSVDGAAQRAQAKEDDLRPTTPGAYRAKEKGGDTQCDLTPAVGDAPARAVCADNAESLMLLTPWMVRGLAADPKRPGDAWVRVDFSPLKERYLPELKSEADKLVGVARSGLETFLKVSDPELLAAPGVISRELFALAGDADAFETSLTIDVNMSELRLSASLATRAEASWVTQVLASATDAPEGPPERFYRLPKDAMSAWWGRTSDPAQFEGVRKILHKGLSALFAMPLPDISSVDKQAFLAWVDGMPTLSGVWAGSSGLLPIAKRPEKNLTAQQAVEEAKNLVRTYLPWGISGGDGDAAPLVAWLKLTEDALNRGATAIKRSSKKDAGAPGWLPSAKFVREAPGYPSGSAALDIGVAFSSKDVWELLPQNKRHELSPGNWGQPEHPKGPEAKGKVTLRIVVVPDDGGHYWWGYSTDLAALKSHMNQVMKGAPAGGQLSSRTDLEILKSHKGFGGFMSYGWLIDMLRNSDAVSPSERKEIDDTVNALPHKGKGAVYLLGSSTGGSAPTFSLDFIAGKDMFDDLSAAVSLGMAAGKTRATHR
jgi:hypothetical protein